MTDRQRDSSVKFLYDLAKGVGLIALVGSGIPSFTEWLDICFDLNLLDLNRRV
jgi:hypothetical protein